MQSGDPVYLILEITENLRIEHSTEIVPRMLALSRLGIRFSIDDFGTGYSSLAYLKRLSLNELKIDESFVQDLPTTPTTSPGRGDHLPRPPTRLRDRHRGRRDPGPVGLPDCPGLRAFQGYFFHRPQPARDWLARLEPALG